MTWSWTLTNPAERDLRKLDVRQRRRILTPLDRFSENPERGDVRKLSGRDDEYRLRVGNWRVRFYYDEPHGVIVVTRVLDRKDAYRD